MGVDDSFSRVVARRRDVEPRLDAIENEADARLQLINRFFTEVWAGIFRRSKQNRIQTLVTQITF